jgi:hypothetical protein
MGRTSHNQDDPVDARSVSRFILSKRGLQYPITWTINITGVEHGKEESDQEG